MHLRRRAYRSRLWLQALEARTVPATTIIVTDPGNAGANTLRQALLDADSEVAPYDGVDTIQFNFGGPATISLAGSISVSKSVEIQGGGTVTIKQTTADRLFKFDNLLVGIQDTFKLSGLTLTGGNITGTTTGDRGGAIAITDEILEIANCWITANTAVAGGGGLAVLAVTGGAGGIMKISDSTISNNVVTGAGNDGGAIRGTTNAGFEITNCVITGNTAADDGGGLYFYRANKTTLTNTTIANNRAAGPDAAGGGVSLGNISNDAVTFTNCTIANNFASQNGGGFRLSTSFTTAGAGLVFNNCTIAGNTAGINGGGIFRDGLVAGATISLNNSVIAHNASAASPDLFASINTVLNVTNSAITTAEGYFITSGSLAFAPGTPLRLGVLANNGSAIQTMLPAAGSPLIQVGPDIGAVDAASPPAPVAVLAGALPVVEKPGDGSFTVTMTYYDATAIKFASIATSNLTVSGPTSPAVSLGAVTPAADASAITVQYVVTPAGGTWDSSENGTYTIALANDVENTGGTKIPAATLGSFRVNVGDIITVTNSAPSGPGSLLDALTLAQGKTPGATDLIQFDSSFNVPTTITLGAALSVTDSVFIEGKGKDLLTIRQAGTNRLFTIDDGSTVTFNQVYLTGMTLRDGKPSGTVVGGAISMTTDYLTLRDVRVTGNSASTGGGIALASTVGGRLYAFNSEFTNNFASSGSSGGGALFTDNTIDNLIFIRDSLISGNTANRGGGVYAQQGAVVIDRSLVSNNLATVSSSTLGGGGLFIQSSSTTTVNHTRGVVIRNSTLTGNSTSGASSGGGAALATSNAWNGQVQIINSTIAYNTAKSQGGGISHIGANGLISIVGSIVDANSAPIDADVRGSADAYASLVNLGPGINNVAGTSLLGVSAKLTPLYNFGGPYSSIATLPGSLARETGIRTGLATDQRGFARVVGNQDMGAVELAANTPIATIGALTPVTSGGAKYTFTVTYFDASSIDTTTINSDELRVTGPAAFNVLATKTGTSGSPTQYIVTYEINAPGLNWDYFDNGDYTVSLDANSAKNTGAVAVPATTFGTFNVAVPAPALEVENDLDSGAGSLRQVLTDANLLSGPAVITFDSVFFSVPRTITLTTGELVVSNDATLTGPGAALLTISGNGASRIFNVANGAKVISFTASGMTLTNGRVLQASDQGGAVYNSGETLVFNNVNFTNNTSAGDGGAIFTQGGSISLTNVVATGNRAPDGPGDGGFLFANTNSAVSVVSSTISGNYAFDGGGGFYISGTSSLSVERSTISGNIADATNAANGGAIYMGISGALTIINSTIAGNTAGQSGGAIRFNNGAVTIHSSTLAYNVARNQTGAGGGGGLFRTAAGTGVLTLENSVVSQNLNLNAGVGDDLGNTGYVGTSFVGFTPLLGRLANNGGPTATILPAPTSALREAGTSTGQPTIDQRGTARPVGGFYDYGSVESPGTEPVAVAPFYADVTTSGGTVHQFTVTYYDDVAIDATTIDGSDVRVHGPGGFTVLATVFSVNTVSPGEVQVTYEFTPPGGGWNGADAGVYRLELLPLQIRDTSTNPIATCDLGSFRVQLAKNYVVTTTADSGAGSLRQAVLDSNAIQGTDGIDTISFDPTVFAGAQTITLTSGSLNVTDSVKVLGAGAKLLNVANGSVGRIFQFYGPGVLTIEVSDMTLSGGKLTGADTTFDAGAAVYERDEQLTMSRMAFVNNTSVNNGGALFIDEPGANVLIADSLFANNAGNNGGAIRLATASTFDLRNSTLSGNSASAGGGAISNNGASITISNSTLAFNTASGAIGGGGLRHIAGTGTLQSVIVAKNTAPTGEDISAAVALTANESLLSKSAVNVTGNNLQVDVDPLLDVLTDNGGPTKTHALKTGSPAIDTGSNVLILSFDQRGNPFTRNVNQTDIGAFEVQPVVAAPPTATVKIDSGTGQRSMIQSITVTFSEAVNVTPTAFTVARLAGSTIPTPNGPVTLSVSPAGPATTFTITFNDPTFAPAVGLAKSLIDGLYTVTLNASQITSAANGQQLDGDGNGTGGDNQATSFHRLYGDVRGSSTTDFVANGFTDNVDLIAFRNANGSDSTMINYDPALDVNSDGFIDNIDLIAFRARLGATP